MVGLRRARDSGATTVEYALIVSFMVLASLGALTLIEDESGEYYSQTADDIGELVDHSSTTTTAPGTTTTASPGSTTTAPPAATTTTAPPATTTTSPAATTTTIAGAQSYIDELEDRSYNTSGSEWKARVRVNIHRDDTGANVQGAVVSGTFTAANGSTKNRSCTTNTQGRCQMSWGSRKDKHDPILFQVTNVVAAPTWDGATASILLPRP